MRQRGMFGHLVTHGDVKEGQVPILFVPSEANLSKSFFACLNHPLYKAIRLGTHPCPLTPVINPVVTTSASRLHKTIASPTLNCTSMPIKNLHSIYHEQPI
jgi:hypothetical protein